MRSLRALCIGLLCIRALSATPTVAAALSDAIFKDAFEAAISAPADAWTWIPFDNAYCGDGSSVGIGINPHAGGSRLLIYMEGGGACYDELTCYVLHSAANFTTGYSAAQFAAEAGSTAYLAQPGGFFDRSAAANPFKDYSYAYVPYCTGDVHSGSNVATLGTHTAHFVGFDNMKAFLSRLYPTFRSVDRVVISGSSAGGFGATLNWWQTQRAFGNVRVDMIDDSGALMPPDILALGNGSDATEYVVWNLAATLPADCVTCPTALDSIISFYSSALPGSRGALLSYTADSVLPGYFGISSAQFTTGLNELEATRFDPVNQPNLAYFTVSGPGHVLLFQPGITTSATTLQQFITLMESDSPAWVSLHP